MKKTFALSITALLLAAGVLWAATPALTANQGVLDAIAALSDNEGLYLPDFTCIDVYGGSGLAIFPSFATGGPGVRDYCIKWVYAPDRRRALYCGANHGSPHKFNDLWEYDLASNTWVMLYKGDGSQPCHTWWGLTYDTVRDTLWWVAGGGCGSWVGWFLHDPEARGGWSRANFANSAPTISLGSTFHYIPDRDIMVWYSASWQGPGMWEYDPKTRLFTRMLSDTVYFDDDCCPGGEAVMSYDTDLKILVAAKGGSIYQFNFTTNEWKPTATGAFNAHDARTPLVYDTRAKMHLLLDAGTLYGYNAAARTVTVLSPTGDTPWAATDVMGFYHEDLEVFAVYKENIKTIWVYKAAPAGGTDVNRTIGTAPDYSVMASPNPFNTTVMISINGHVADGVASLHCNDATHPYTVVYNINGKLVADFRQSAIEWSPRNLPAGVYLIRARVNGRTLQKKVVLQR